MDVENFFADDKMDEARRIAEDRRQAVMSLVPKLDEVRQVIMNSMNEADWKELLGPTWGELLDLLERIFEALPRRAMAEVMRKNAGADAENLCFDLEKLSRFTGKPIEVLRAGIEAQNRRIAERRSVWKSQDEVMQILQRLARQHPNDDPTRTNLPQ